MGASHPPRFVQQLGQGLVAWTLSCPAFAFREPVDLCSVPDTIVIGKVAGLDSSWREGGPPRRAVTRVEVAVESVLLGGPLESVDFDIGGGEIDGVKVEESEAPTPALGDRYIWFLDFLPDRGTYLWLDRRALKAGAALPDETNLRWMWERLCSAHPEGIPPVADPEAPSLAVLDWTRREQWSQDEADSPLRALMDLRSCPTHRLMREATSLEEGVCPGGWLDRPPSGW